MSDKIKSQDLPKLWLSPDNTKLMPNQLSIRLPVHVAAKLFALEDIFPNKTRTEIIADLLSCALEDVIQSLPYEGVGDPIGKDPEDGEEIYNHYTGLGPHFQNRLQERTDEIEQELSKTDNKRAKKK